MEADVQKWSEQIQLKMGKNAYMYIVQYIVYIVAAKLKWSNLPQLYMLHKFNLISLLRRATQSSTSFINAIHHFATIKWNPLPFFLPIFLTLPCGC